MFPMQKIKMHLSFGVCLFTLLSVSFIKANQNTIEIQDVNFSFEDQTASFNISTPKRVKQVNETKTISMKISEFREVFPNKLSSNSFTLFPQMSLTDNKTDYEEQKIKCNKINLQSNNFLSYNLTNILKNSTSKNTPQSLADLAAKQPALEIQYFLFQEPGWIDDQTNYVRPGNLMIEVNIHNYTFCEDLAAIYNKAIEALSSSVVGIDVNAFPNCNGIWSKNETSGKLNLIQNKNLNISNPSWENKSYFEIAFELNTNDDTNYVYDDPKKALELKTDNSYLRLYQEIKLDDEVNKMEDKYPIINWNAAQKKIVLQIPKFRSKGTAWIFIDMNYMQPPPNFKSFSTIAFFVMLACAVLFLVYMLIKRKKMKEQLSMDEKLNSLSTV